MPEALDQIQDEEPFSNGEEPLPAHEEPQRAGDEVEVEAHDEPEPEPEAELDPEVVARRDAALAHVRKFGDPVLKTKARPVERFDDALRDEVAPGWGC